jgi:hypothetical protein
MNKVFAFRHQALRRLIAEGAMAREETEAWKRPSHSCSS